MAWKRPVLFAGRFARRANPSRRGRILYGAWCVELLARGRGMMALAGLGTIVAFTVAYVLQ